MLLVPLLLAPAVMAGAVLAERRAGPAAAGWFAALPIAFSIAVVALVVDAGVDAAASMARSAAGHVAAQVLFAVVGAAVLLRRGVPAGLAAGAGAYALGSLVLAPVPLTAAVLVAVALLVAGPRWMPTVDSATPARRSPATTVALCLAAPVIVGAALLTSRLAGPQLAGAVAAFPTMCLTLTVTLTWGGHRRIGGHTLFGLVRSLPCYLTVCLVLAIALPTLGMVAVPIGLAAGVAVGRITWGGLRPVRRSLRSAT